MPIFLSRVTVALDVTDYFRIYLTSSIETERSFNLFVLQVTIDCLRATDYLYTGVDSLVVFSQYASICVGIVTADDNQCLDIQLFQDFQSLVELFFCFQFGTT